MSDRLSVVVPSTDYRFPRYVGKRERCSKCGNREVDTTYSSRGWLPSGDILHGIAYPHLHIICPCGFSWIKAPLDAERKTA